MGKKKKKRRGAKFWRGQTWDSLGNEGNQCNYNYLKGITLTGVSTVVG